MVTTGDEHSDIPGDVARATSPMSFWVAQRFRRRV